MVERDAIIKVLFDTVEGFNQQLPTKQQLEKSTETILFGKSGTLDSLGLVNLIVAVEQNIEEVFESTITIADERAMSQQKSPFKTIGTLADYIFILLQETLDE